MNKALLLAAPGGITSPKGATYTREALQIYMMLRSCTCFRPHDTGFQSFVLREFGIFKLDFGSSPN
jgi:hypothetical protein